jgi:hypothetical protein
MRLGPRSNNDLRLLSSATHLAEVVGEYYTRDLSHDVLILLWVHLEL